MPYNPATDSLPIAPRMNSGEDRYNMIDDNFPSQGQPKGAHEGSQSYSPNKSESEYLHYNRPMKKLKEPE